MSPHLLLYSSYSFTKRSSAELLFLLNLQVQHIRVNAVIFSVIVISELLAAAQCMVKGDDTLYYIKVVLCQSLLCAICPTVSSRKAYAWIEGSSCHIGSIKGLCQLVLCHSNIGTIIKQLQGEGRPVDNSIGKCCSSSKSNV